MRGTAWVTQPRDVVMTDGIWQRLKWGWDRGGGISGIVVAAKSYLQEAARL